MRATATIFSQGQEQGQAEVWHYCKHVMFQAWGLQRLAASCSYISYMCGRKCIGCIEGPVVEYGKIKEIGAGLLEIGK